jgi:hypothetical protein
MGTNNDYFDRMTKLALHSARDVTDEQLYRQVKSILKEVERDTRHAAHEIVSEALSNVMNLRHK